MEQKLENILKKRFNKDELIKFINNSTDVFNDAINLALSEKQPEAWRSSWLLGHCIQENDNRIIAHIKPILDSIPSRKDGHQRELIKILSKMEIEEEMEGSLFNDCMNIWESINKSPSVRIIAFRVLIKIAKKYPELNNEIEFLTQDQYIKTLSPGIRNSFKKLIKSNNLIKAV